MMDLTPLDVRKKRGDFRRGLRGYDPEEVDQFLELVSERLEEVVKENLTLRERVERLGQQVEGQEGREKAVQEALVTAQELREEIRDQARREADLTLREARGEAEELRRAAQEEARRARDDAERLLAERRHELVELNRARSRFLRAFRSLLEREMDALELEEEKTPADDFPPLPDEADPADDDPADDDAPNADDDPADEDARS